MKGGEVDGRQQRKMTPICEYLKVMCSFYWFSYKHLAFLDIQVVSFACCCEGHRRYSRRELTTQYFVWFQSGLENSEECSLQGELLLYTPQGLSAMLQLLLLIGLQCHVNDICQTAVAQDTGDAQEDIILHSMHALSDKDRTQGRQQGKR